MIDLLVIGAGLTGLVAALRAAESGRRVKVIAKGMGAHHWNAGTIDVLGYAGIAERPVATPWQQMANLDDDHPYQLVGHAAARQSIGWFMTTAAGSGLDYTGAADERNLLLPSPAGAWRPVLLAPAGQRGGAADKTQPMLIAGLHGMRDFYPHLIVRNLVASGQPARAATLPWSVVSEARDRNNVQLAELLDEPATQQRLISALKLVAQPGERIGLPAILGLHRHGDALATLQRDLRCTVFEIPTLPPSVPGIRLTTALRRALAQRDVRVEVGMEVIGFHAEHGAIQWVETATSARPLRHRAGAYLLATGGVLGGGFSSDHAGRFWETVFNLPLTVPQDRARWFRPRFLDPQGQPAFHGGVSVSSSFQPVDADGRPVYTNLWAAGGALAHADPILERSLEGIAIVTGVAAADAIVRELNVEGVRG